MDCEREWFDRAKRGDHKAFERLVAPHRTRVLVYCKRLLDNAPEYEDAAQETLVQAWQHLDGFHCKGPFGHWLMKIARHACLGVLRTKQARIYKSTDSIYTIDEQSTAKSGLPANHLEETVVAKIYESSLLRTIKHRADNARPRWDLLDWQIFHWHYEQNVTIIREVAQRVGRNENTVKYRLYNHIRPVLQKVCQELAEAERMEGG